MIATPHCGMPHHDVPQHVIVVRKETPANSLAAGPDGGSTPTVRIVEPARANKESQSDRAERLAKRMERFSPELTALMIERSRLMPDEE